MRAVFAMLFGSLLLWMQALAVASPHLVLEERLCQCCDCGQPCCSSPRVADPRPTSPITRTALEEKTPPLLQNAPRFSSSSVPVFSSAAAHSRAIARLRPNFGLALSPHQQHCVLLI